MAPWGRSNRATSGKADEVFMIGVMVAVVPQRVQYRFADCMSPLRTSPGRPPFQIVPASAPPWLVH
jgi:hypothetical protein